jgi:hypothetical protein
MLEEEILSTNKKIKSSCLKIHKFTDEDLERFRKDPKHNPKTGRPISEKGSIYKKLKRDLENKDTLQNIPPKVIVKKLRPKGLAVATPAVAVPATVPATTVPATVTPVAVHFISTTNEQK